MQFRSFYEFFTPFLMNYPQSEESETQMLVIAVRFVEGMFVIGGLGCLIVLILTAIEDVRTLFGLDDNEESAPAPQRSNADHPTYTPSPVAR